MLCVPLAPHKHRQHTGSVEAEIGGNWAKTKCLMLVFGWYHGRSYFCHPVRKVSHMTCHFSCSTECELPIWRTSAARFNNPLYACRNMKWTKAGLWKYHHSFLYFNIFLYGSRLLQPRRHFSYACFTIVVAMIFQYEIDFLNTLHEERNTVRTEAERIL